MKSILFPMILFICLLLAGCELFQQNEYYHLPDFTRSNLKTGDYLVYEDCNSMKDTFRVHQKISGTYKSPLTGSNCGEPAQYYDLELVYLVSQKEWGANEYCRYLNTATKFGACENDYHCDHFILFSIQASESNKKMNSNSYPPHLWWYGGPAGYKITFINSMTVLNNSYDNVFHYEGEFIHNGDSIKGIYYSCQYGIIQMDMSDGNELKLVR